MRTTLLSSVLLACAASPIFAQDSVGLPPNHLPGDAVNAHDTTEQVNDYIVDQTAVHSSWGNVFGVAPVVKCSKLRDGPPAPDFFSMTTSAQAMSRLQRSGVPFVRSSYDLWSAQGFGVNNNPVLNNPGTAIPTTGMTGFQFGVATSEFGSGTADPLGSPASLNQIIGGLVNYTAALPSRLYVSRVVTAINGMNDGCNLSQFGFGAMDEDGNVHFRADNFGANISCNGFTGLTANNWFRVRMLARAAGSLNFIHNAGASDAAATDWLLVNDGTTYNVPGIIPNSVAGRPIMNGLNFMIQYAHEAVAGVLTVGAAGAHLGTGLTDHRGAQGWSPHNFTGLFTAAAVNGTAGQLARTTTLTDSLNLFGLNSAGNAVGSIARTLPATITDPVQAWSNAVLTGSHGFDHHHSQTSARGNSQVSVGRDQAGRLMAAATVYYGFTPPQGSSAHNQNPSNYVAVSRTDPVTGATEWSVAGWTKQANTWNTAATPDGKTVFQNGTTAIGRMTGVVTAGTNIEGPAISAPMIDSVGNVWFLAAVQLDGPPVTVTTGLIRAVYDPSNFSYKLELVLKRGDVFQGRNSATAYQIRFLELKDSNSVGSGTAWSGNASASADRNMSTTSLSTSDARTLGGLVLAAGIIYDVNNDGLYVRQVGTGGDPTSPDEDYQVLLYVSASNDCNNNNIPDDRDIFDGTSTDVNGNGIPDSCEGGTGLPFCFPGLGGVSPCVCNNPAGPGAGCANTGSAGGSLSSAGLQSLAADTVVLTGTNMLSGSSCIFLQGSLLVPTGAPFGAGIRCAGGSLKRLYVKSLVGTGGTKSAPELGDLSISARSAALGDTILAGQSRFYQTYYRDPSLVNPGLGCPTIATFNITSGQVVAWVP